MDRRSFLTVSLAATISGRANSRAAVGVSRLLYVVCPGIRDYLEFGGAGILVFDIDAGHKFVKRLATTASADGKTLFVPSFEKDTWNVVDALTGAVVTSIETKSGAHNTVCGLDGKRAYL